jgi:hypothetical protein
VQRVPLTAIHASMRRPREKLDARGTCSRRSRPTRSIMIDRPGARSVPAEHFLVRLDLAARAVLPLSPGLPTMGAMMTFLGRGKA